MHRVTAGSNKGICELWKCGSDGATKILNFIKLLMLSLVIGNSYITNKFETRQYLFKIFKKSIILEV